MSHFLPKAAVGFFVFLLISCKPVSTVTITVKNNSNKDIVVYNLFTGSEVFLYHGQYKSEKQNKSGSYNEVKSNEFCPCTGEPKMLSLDTNYKIIKDINECGNWTHDSKKGSVKKGGKFSCVYELTDEDLKKK